MKARSRSSIIAPLMLVAASATAIAQPVFTPLAAPFAVNTMNSDGSVLGGVKIFTFEDPVELPALWTPTGGMQLLPLLPETNYGGAYGLSENGAIAAGSVTFNGVFARYRATIWRNGEATPIGFLPGDSYSGATAVSGDGTTVIGWSEGMGSHAFIWTEVDGMQGIGDELGRVTAVSYDGSVVAANGYLSPAFRWTREGGIQPLGTTPDGFTMSQPGAMNADGSVIAGTGHFRNGDAHEFGVFRWTGKAGLEYLGAITPRPEAEVPLTSVRDMTAAGDAFVGDSTDANIFGFGPPPTAVYWTRATGLVDLNQYLPSLGVNLRGYFLSNATAISADGTIIAGIWAEPGTFNSGSWIVTGMPPPGAEPECPADLNADGFVNSQDFFDFLAAFFKNDPGADFNRDGALDSRDFFDFFAEFLAGCPQ